jgi:hypothetical protein
LSIGKNKKEVGGGKEKKPPPAERKYAGTLLHSSVEDKFPAVGNHF